MVLVIAASVVGDVVWALNAPLPSPVANTRSLTAPATQPAAFALPTDGATAVTVTGAPDYLGAGGVHLTAGDESPRPIASISKVITVLVVLDALATMLIPSASNYADAVSTWAYGSRCVFLAATDDFLAREGLTSTTIVEPTGISPRNVSTPSDLLRIAQLAAANSTIRAIAATPDITLPGPGHLTNPTPLLGEGGVTGLKTGNLGEGTFSLLFTATVDTGVGEPLDVTGITLGGASRSSQDAAVLGLLDSIRAGFRDVPLVSAETLVGSYTTAWGATAQLVVADAASLRTWSDTPIMIATDITNPTEYRDGEQVGSVTWTAGPAHTTAALRVRGTIEPPTDWWRLTHPAELLG